MDEYNSFGDNCALYRLECANLCACLLDIQSLLNPRYLIIKMPFQQFEACGYASVKNSVYLYTIKYVLHLKRCHKIAQMCVLQHHTAIKVTILMILFSIKPT